MGRSWRDYLNSNILKHAAKKRKDAKILEEFVDKYNDFWDHE